MPHFFSNAKKCGCELKEIEMTARMFVSLVLLPFLMQPTTFAQAQSSFGPVVGSSIKEFTLKDQHGSPIKLSEMLFDGTTAFVVVKSAGW